MSDEDLEPADVVPLFPAAEGDPPLTTRARPPYCAHQSTELDTEARRVYCRTCGREVDAFDALHTLANSSERFQQHRAQAEREARRAYSELELVKRELRNAKSRVRRQRQTDELAARRPRA